MFEKGQMGEGAKRLPELGNEGGVPLKTVLGIWLDDCIHDLTATYTRPAHYQAKKISQHFQTQHILDSVNYNNQNQTTKT